MNTLRSPTRNSRRIANEDGMTSSRVRGVMGMPRWYALGLSIGLAWIAGCGMDATGDAPEEPESAASKFHRATQPLPDRYIVMLKDGASRRSLTSARVDDQANELSARYGAEVRATWQSVGGFAATMSERDAMALAAEPHVLSVSEDSVVRAVETQSPATWGLDRIDQAALPLDDA